MAKITIAAEFLREGSTTPTVLSVTSEDYRDGMKTFRRILRKKLGLTILQAQNYLALRDVKGSKTYKFSLPKGYKLSLESEKKTPTKREISLK